MIVDLIDKLVDRVVQLLNHKKQINEKLLQQYVVPVFNEFEQVHSAYLESFLCYRALIESSSDPAWLQSLHVMVERDNLFTAHNRSKLMQLAEIDADEIFGAFVTEIHEYLLGARLVNSLGSEMFPHLIQRWRKSFLSTLKWISDEHWQMVLDPNGAGPPMPPETITDELAELSAKYPVQISNSSANDLLKRSSALWALDQVVQEMQSQYHRICNAYAQLQTSLQN
jgi:hypothetical protein